MHFTIDVSKIIHTKHTQHTPISKNNQAPILSSLPRPNKYGDLRIVIAGNLYNP